MVSYNCKRCGYNTYRVSNYKTHIYKQRICKPINSDTPINEIRDQLNSKISRGRNRMRNRMRNRDTVTLGDKLNIYSCRFCNKEFSKHQQPI